MTKTTGTATKATGTARPTLEGLVSQQSWRAKACAHNQLEHKRHGFKVR